MLINFLHIVSFPSSVTRQPAVGRREQTSCDGEGSWQWDPRSAPYIGDVPQSSGLGLHHELGIDNGLDIALCVGVAHELSIAHELGLPHGLGIVHELSAARELGLPHGLGIAHRSRLLHELELPMS